MITHSQWSACMLSVVWLLYVNTLSNKRRRSTHLRSSPQPWQARQDPLSTPGSIMQRFEGKTVIVTGGGGGIGGATCRRFAQGRRPRRGVRPEPRCGREGGCGHPGRGRTGRGVPLRHHGPRQRRCRRGGDGSPAGPRRRAGQQRGLGRVQAVHQDRAGPVGQADRDQPDRRAAHAPRRAARHGGAQAGTHRQHRIRRGPRRLVRRGGLCSVQGRPGRVLQDHRA